MNATSTPGQPLRLLRLPLHMQVLVFAAGAFENYVEIPAESGLQILSNAVLGRKIRKVPGAQVKRRPACRGDHHLDALAGEDPAGRLERDQHFRSKTREPHSRRKRRRSDGESHWATPTV